MVASEDDRHCAAAQNLSNGDFSPTLVIARDRQIRQHIAAIDEANVGSSLQQWPANIEIVVFRRPDHAIGYIANGLRCVCLVIGIASGPVGRAERHSQDRDVRLEILKVRDKLRVQQGSMVRARWDSQLFHCFR